MTAEPPLHVNLGITLINTAGAHKIENVETTLFVSDVAGVTLVMSPVSPYKGLTGTLQSTSSADKILSANKGPSRHGLMRWIPFVDDRRVA